jgi:hypothetical protein
MDMDNRSSYLGTDCVYSKYPHSCIGQTPIPENSKDLLSFLMAYLHLMHLNVSFDIKEYGI